MQSAYDDIFSALEDYTFTIPSVNIRKPYDESSKEYPLIVVHEIVNLPMKHGTVNGETRTMLSYQFDIQTQNCIDSEGTVLTRWIAGQRLISELTALVDTTFKLTRRSIHEIPIAADVLSNMWRGDCVLDSHGYSYRR